MTPTAPVPQERLRLLFGQRQAALEEDERGGRRLVPVRHLEIADERAVVPLPQENVGLGQGPADVVLDNAIAEFRGGIVSGIGEFFSCVAREHLQQRQAAPGIARNQGAARAARLGQQPLPGDHQRHYGAIIVENATHREGVGIVPFGGQRLQIDEWIVIAGHRIGPRLHRNALAIGGEQHRLGSAEVLVLDRGADHGFNIVPRRIGQQQRGIVAQGQPGGQARHIAATLVQVLRIGDNQGRDRSAADQLMPASIGDRALAEQSDEVPVGQLSARANRVPTAWTSIGFHVAMVRCKSASSSRSRMMNRGALSSPARQATWRSWLRGSAGHTTTRSTFGKRADHSARGRPFSQTSGSAVVRPMRVRRSSMPSRKLPTGTMVCGLSAVRKDFRYGVVMGESNSTMASGIGAGHGRCEHECFLVGENTGEIDGWLRRFRRCAGRDQGASETEQQGETKHPCFMDHCEPSESEETVFRGRSPPREDWNGVGRDTTGSGILLRGGAEKCQTILRTPLAA